MPNRYELADEELAQRVARVRDEYHDELIGVRVGVLVVFDADGAQEPVLEHQGYPAAAKVRIVSARDRASGLPDAQIIVDLVVYKNTFEAERDALIDHEFYHLVPVLDEGGGTKQDAQGRPKLKIRKHDRQFGWFDEIARRHGMHSFEIRQAQGLFHDAQQLYFDFSRAPAPPRIDVDARTH